MKKTILISTVIIALVFGFGLFTLTNANTKNSKEKVTLYFFWGEGCPYCTKQKAFIEQMKKKYPHVVFKDYEVWNNVENRKLFIEMSQKYNITPRGVPITFIGSKVFMGFNEQIGMDIEKHIKTCIKSKSMC